MSEQRSGFNRRTCNNIGSSNRRRSSNAARAVALAALGAVTGLTATASAADKFWDASSGGWENPDNWSPVGVPTSGDNAFINNGGTAILTTDQSVNRLSPGSAAGTSGSILHTAGILMSGEHVLLSEGVGSTSTYTMSGGALNALGVVYVGSHGTSTLDLSGTSSINAAANFQVGANGTAVGMVNMSGGSIVTPFMLTGHVGDGTVNMSGGTIEVNNFNVGQHTFATTGREALGIFNQSGGTVTIKSAGVLAELSKAANLYDLSGGTLNMGNATTSDVSMRVGAQGDATMKIRGTGVANIGRHLIVGGSSGSPISTSSLGTLEVSGGTANIGTGTAGDGALGIGAWGKGVFTFTGGTINTDDVLHGYNASTSAVATGSEGQATQSGGSLSVGDDMRVGSASDKNNFWEITGGTIDVTDQLTVAEFSSDTDFDPPGGNTQPPAMYSNGRLTIDGTASVTVGGQLSNSLGWEQTAGPNMGKILSGGTGLIEVKGGSLTAANFVNGRAPDPSLPNGGSASYVQTGGTASVGEVTGTGTVSVSGGTMNVSSLSQSAANVSATGVVQVTPGGTTSQLGDLSISGSGKVDLTNNRMVISNTPASTIRQYIINGRGGAGGTGTWTGNGLTSSSAAANPHRAVGYVDNGDSVTVSYAAPGDGDLDRAVTLTDINYVVAAGFTGAPVSGTDWKTGDYDYDGSTTLTDINMVVAGGEFNAGPYDRASSAVPAAFAEPTATTPTLVVDPSNGTASLDTAGLDLSAFQIQSRGANGQITAVGDGDGYLLAGKADLGDFFFNSSTRDEYGGALGSLDPGVYDLGQLFDPSLLSLPVSGEMVLSDLRFGYNGDASAQGNGMVVLIPEPASLSLLALGSGLLLVRRRRA